VKVLLEEEFVIVRGEIIYVATTPPIEQVIVGRRRSTQQVEISKDKIKYSLYTHAKGVPIVAYFEGGK
jgi:hypothetical protein